MPTGHRAAPPVDTVRVAYSGTYRGHPWAAVMWVKVTTSGPRVQADLDSLTVALAAKWAARLGTLPGSQYAGNLCSTEWQTGVATTLQSAASTVDVPSANSGINDAAACVLFVWITGERYRGDRKS